MQMSIDGFVGGPNGESDFMTWNPDEKFVAFLNYLLDSSDTLLLGRKMTDGFITYWEHAANNSPETPFAKKIAAIQKVVFTKTLHKSTWKNTTLAKGNLAEEIASLKNKEGKDILVFGGAGFVSSLIKEGLIDEYYLIINPTAIGKGVSIFHSLDSKQLFTPIESTLYSGGKTVLGFKPKND